MTNVSLPMTPDERIKLYDWVTTDDKVYERLGLPAPPNKRIFLVTKILLLGESIRLEVSYDPMRNMPTEYSWMHPDDLIVVPM